MNLPQFLIALFEYGRVRPPVSASGDAPSPFGGEELADADRVLAETEAMIRLDFPGEAPPFSDSAARWAATRFYRACQFVVSRNSSADVVDAALSEPAAPPACPSSAYSVDLVFRFLPDLRRLAKSVSQDDPLVTRIEAWTTKWPYSSVAMSVAAEDIEPPRLEAVVGHRGLLRAYADRILSAGDTSRMTDPRVRQAIQEALGSHAELAPAIAALFESDDAIA